jgi:hypothetical protein
MGGSTDRYSKGNRRIFATFHCKSVKKSKKEFSLKGLDERILLILRKSTDLRISGCCVKGFEQPNVTIPNKLKTAN